MHKLVAQHSHAAVLVSKAGGAAEVCFGLIHTLLTMLTETTWCTVHCKPFQITLTHPTEPHLDA